MRRRLPWVVLFALAALAIAYALLGMVWYRGEWLLGEVEIRLLGGNTEYVVTDPAYNWMCLIGGLVCGYYTLRLVFMAVTLLANTPINHTVAWLSPRSAYLQSGLVFAVAVVTMFMPVSASLEHVYPVGELVREWQAPLTLLAGIALAFGGMIAVARTPELAATQGWRFAELPEGHELLADLEPIRRERPMTRPPPVAMVAAVDANPMRAPPANDLRARTVKTAREPDAPPIADDPDAPAPKFLG